MRIDLAEMIEHGENVALLFAKKSGVLYSWDTGGRLHERLTLQGYAVPVGDSIIRAQLREIHVGCGGRLTDEEMDQLDSVFRLAGVPFVVAREELYWLNSTENAVWVQFPSKEEEIPIPGSRFAKWAWAWGKVALFVWWQCESLLEYDIRRRWEESEQQNEAQAVNDGTNGQKESLHYHGIV